MNDATNTSTPRISRRATVAGLGASRLGYVLSARGQADAESYEAEHETLTTAFETGEEASQSSNSLLRNSSVAR